MKSKSSVLCIPVITTLDGFFPGFNAISIKIFFESHKFLVSGSDGFSKNCWQMACF